MFKIERYLEEAYFWMKEGWFDIPVTLTIAIAITRTQLPTLKMRCL